MNRIVHKLLEFDLYKLDSSLVSLLAEASLYRNLGSFVKRAKFG
jgi:hypothetical protein